MGWGVVVLVTQAHNVFSLSTPILMKALHYKGRREGGVFFYVRPFKISVTSQVSYKYANAAVTHILKSG